VSPLPFGGPRLRADESGRRADRARDKPAMQPARDHDVRRLDVTVDKPCAVRRLQARRHLGDDVHGLRGVERAAGQHTSQGRPSISSITRYDWPRSGSP
jgi:hypothetical protein